MSNPKAWSISKIWDEAFERGPEIIEPRGYLYASEIGGSFVDTFYKMKGVPYTNLPTNASRKKMEAGKVWESIVMFVLKRAGLMRKTQEKIDFQLHGLLSVHGKLDYVCGGHIDLRQSEDFTLMIKILFEELAMPRIYLEIANRVLAMVEEMREGNIVFDLVEYVTEVKSVSSYVWDLVEASGKPAAYHLLQVFHYIYGKEKPEGKVLYINRDDCRLKEIAVLNNRENFQAYSGWVEKMTDYWNAGKEPPKEPLIVFDPYAFSFRKNTMGIEWSRYLTLIYGYNSPNDYREHVGKFVEQMNRVFKRCVNGDKMTALNLEVITKAKDYFPNWDDMVDKGKMNAVLVSEAEEISE